MAIEHINSCYVCPTFPDRPAHTLINPFHVPNLTLISGASPPYPDSNALQLTRQSPAKILF